MKKLWSFAKPNTQGACLRLPLRSVRSGKGVWGDLRGHLGTFSKNNFTFFGPTGSTLIPAIILAAQLTSTESMPPITLNFTHFSEKTNMAGLRARCPGAITARLGQLMLPLHNV